jgi:hypothetical protein
VEYGKQRPVCEKIFFENIFAGSNIDCIFAASSAR